mmetsp:Transcript_116859/g.162298  ORF Transcript_116859/g.162298 Transcript_116859/m.162298 type:complete len:137 (-) Transcript_116859:588-998(-)|eukprot:CAMPEP_0176346808 /NCGR_PEP_ID=MMETSP0126-20121128/6525_1 /TAXON_ID=141414 ORGANISM="Strombidinopsis acuminatum, Strain SPMC142" /NCGR_SAMPLE_ID=MMETSP0126 /ASSEMBLY_ACC=CAM_ASM_000229 /LENGTH=136 /DNA_ID=CAMNT_0017694549 /DNA_START=1810 /DNA_END=2220 /DNA_ORIENTATION=-
MQILEHFSFNFFDRDTQKIFANKEEAYEFAYLLIVLQTVQHNPSIKEKTKLSTFREGAEGICGESMKNTFPENFIEDVYDSITENEVFTPITRSLYTGSFNKCSLTEIDIRLANSEDKEDTYVLKEDEFFASADLL